jgi:hypothetical protein
MFGKICFSRWLMAATVLALAVCASVASIEISSPAAAQARSSGDQHFRSRRLRPQSDNFFQTLLGSSNSRQQRKPHRPSDSWRAQRKTKLKPELSEPTTSEKPATPSVSAIATVEYVPLPRPRPSPSAEPQSFAEVAGPDFDTADVSSAPSDCDERLATTAAIELLPRLIGPGDCGGRDIVEMDAVLLPNHRRVEVKPAAVLRCVMAESFAAWVRDEVSTRITTLGGALHGVETYGSYECRGRNGALYGKLSEHGKGNAIDVRAFVLTGGRRIELTDTAIAKPLREELRDSACHRFSTVLGPGADSNHSSHIHLDILERNHGNRICQWEVREPPLQMASMHVPLPIPRPAIACGQGKRRACFHL